VQGVLVGDRVSSHGEYVGVEPGRDAALAVARAAHSGRDVSCSGEGGDRRRAPSSTRNVMPPAGSCGARGGMRRRGTTAVIPVKEDQ